MTENLQIPSAVRADDGDRLLTTIEVAGLLAVSPHTLRWWRNWTHTGPPFFRFGGRRGHVRYSRADLQRWLDAQRVTGGNRDKDVRLSEVRKAVRSEAGMAEVSHTEVSGCGAQGTQPRSEGESRIG